MKRIFKILPKLFIFIFLIIISLYLILIYGNINLKKYMGGKVLNNSNHNIFISNYKRIIMLKPGQTSLDVKMKDADLIFIQHPTKFKNKIYNKGVIKFCDTAKLEIITDSGMDKIKQSLPTILCTIMDDYDWYSYVPLKLIKNNK